LCVVSLCGQVESPTCEFVSLKSGRATPRSAQRERDNWRGTRLDALSYPRAVYPTTFIPHINEIHTLRSYQRHSHPTPSLYSNSLSETIADNVRSRFGPGRVHSRHRPAISRPTRQVRKPASAITTAGEAARARPTHCTCGPTRAAVRALPSPAGAASRACRIRAEAVHSRTQRSTETHRSGDTRHDQIAPQPPELEERAQADGVVAARRRRRARRTCSSAGARERGARARRDGPRPNPCRMNDVDVAWAQITACTKGASSNCTAARGRGPSSRDAAAAQLPCCNHQRHKSHGRGMA
jgi:hypothetical protein